MTQTATATNMKFGLVKLALRREDGYPIGVTAPVYCLCPCGQRILITAELNTCQCGMAVDGSGWIEQRP